MSAAPRALTYSGISGRFTLSTPSAVLSDCTKPALCTMPPMSTTSSSMPTRRAMAHTRLATASSTALAMSSLGVDEWISDTTSDSANTVHWAFIGIVLSERRLASPNSLSESCSARDMDSAKAPAPAAHFSLPAKSTTLPAGSALMPRPSSAPTSITVLLLGHMNTAPMAPADTSVMSSLANFTCLRPAPVATTLPTWSRLRPAPSRSTLRFSTNTTLTVREPMSMPAVITCRLLVKSCVSEFALQAQRLHEGVDAVLGTHQVEFALVAHVAFEGHHRNAAGGQAEEVFHDADGKALAAAVQVQHDAVDLPLLDDGLHHLGLDARIVEVLPLRLGQVPVAVQAHRLLARAHFDALLPRQGARAPGAVRLGLPDAFEAEGIQRADRHRAVFLEVAEYLEEAPWRLRVGHDPAALVGHGGDAARHAVLHLVQALLVEVGAPLGRLRQRGQHVQRVHGLLVERRGDRLVLLADRGPQRGGAHLVLDGLDEQLVVELAAGGLLQPFARFQALVGDVHQAVFGEILVRAARDLDEERRGVFQLGGILVPLGVGTADLRLEVEVRLGELAAERVLVQQDGTPVGAHVSAQIARESGGLGGVLAFLVELLVHRDGGAVGLAE